MKANADVGGTFLKSEIKFHPEYVTPTSSTPTKIIRPIAPGPLASFSSIAAEPACGRGAASMVELDTDTVSSDRWDTIARHNRRNYLSAASSSDDTPSALLPRWARCRKFSFQDKLLRSASGRT